MMAATGIVAWLEAWWPWFSGRGADRHQKVDSAVCSAPQLFSGLSSVREHFLTGFVLSTQLCLFLVLGLSHEGTQQASPFPGCLSAS